MLSRVMQRILNGRLIEVVMENMRNNSTPFFVQLLCQKYRCTPLIVSEEETQKNFHSETTIESSIVVSHESKVSDAENGTPD